MASCVEKKCFKESKHTEVIFPNKFTAIHPWGDYPAKSKKLVKLEVTNLIHVTHNAERDSICIEEHKFKYNVKKKLGKNKYYDSKSCECGGSYRSIKDGKEFCQVESDKEIFPGYYSWWGIYPTTSAVDDIKQKIKMIPQVSDVFVAGYLQAERISPYGSRGFVCNFNNILAAYAASRDTGVDNVYLRKGGALRYTNEICYVIIVCVGTDLEALKDYVALQSSKQFNTDCLIDENGRVSNPRATPKFYPNHVVSWYVDSSEDQPKSFSYETLVFTFYYPHDGCTMTLNRDDCREQWVRHDKEFCLKKQQPPGVGRWSCPHHI